MELKDKLFELRKKAGLSRAQFSKLLGVSESVVAKWERGERYPNKDSLYDLAQFYGVSVGELMGEDRDVASIAVPVLGEVSAGLPMYATENILDYEEIPSAMAKAGEYFGLRIHGNSMYPRMQEGDIVIVKKQPVAEDGQTVVVLVNGDSATVKKIQIRDDGIMLIPNNPDYAPMFYSSKAVRTLPVQILGVVVELRAKYV